MEVSPASYRHTKIIATLGPATESKDQLARLILRGVDVLRLNMAHGLREWVGEIISNIREVSSTVGRHVAVMIDVKGPEIRTGPLEQPLSLNAGDVLEFHTNTDGNYNGNASRVSVNYSGLPYDVEVGATILVDSGLIKLRVLDNAPANDKVIDTLQLSQVE